ncbi:MAG: DUF3096 domain-containing protein [Chloroflexota bacterium]
MPFGLSRTVAGIIAIAAGIIILIWPEALQLVIAIFLIVWGIITLLGKR